MPNSAALPTRPAADPCTRNPERSEMVSQTGFTCGDGMKNNSQGLLTLQTQPLRAVHRVYCKLQLFTGFTDAADATTECSAQGLLAPSLLGEEDRSAEKSGHQRGATLHWNTRRTLRRRRSEALAFNTAGHRGAYHHGPGLAPLHSTSPPPRLHHSCPLPPTPPPGRSPRALGSAPAARSPPRWWCRFGRYLCVLCYMLLCVLTRVSGGLRPAAAAASLPRSGRPL